MHVQKRDVVVAAVDVWLLEELKASSLFLVIISLFFNKVGLVFLINH
jgi:hypothetical protein